MGAPRLIRRVVFDTNTVVSALLFSRGRLAWLREAWRSRSLIPLVSKPSTSELLRVLTYPKFHLTPIDREELLADYLPFAEVISEGEYTPDLPACRDPADLPFMQLAVIGHADALVSGDQDILVLKPDLPFSVLTPAELERVFSGPS